MENIHSFSKEASGRPQRVTGCRKPPVETSFAFGCGWVRGAPGSQEPRQPWGHGMTEGAGVSDQTKRTQAEHQIWTSPIRFLAPNLPA